MLKIKTIFSILSVLSFMLMTAGCNKEIETAEEMIEIIDQLGRKVSVPKDIKKIAALHHFGGKIAYALGQQEKLVEQSLYGMEAAAMTKVNPAFAAKPSLLEGKSVNIEELIALEPELAFVYASFEKSEMDLLENAGIKVVALKGETITQSFQAVELMAEILDCHDRAVKYINKCKSILATVHNRLSGVQERKKVMFTGPNGLYSVATGEMLQTEILERSGAVNVASGLKGFWAEVSPEQVAVWNPDTIFLGSYLNGAKGLREFQENEHFRTIRAIKENRVYRFPSNIGWWDYPAPNCVLGVLWSAKTLYPDLFADIDVLRIADDFYREYTGFSYTAMGGKL